MPLLVRASIGWHAAAGGLAVLVPGTVEWSLAAIAANHAALAAAGLWPRSRLLGPNWTRLPRQAAARGEIALTFDDGPDPAVTPAVLDLLDRHDARATFFCIAERASRHPKLTREMVARGHSVQNHSHRHRHNFSLLGPAALAREITRAQQVLTEISGTRPSCFRAPAGFRNVFLDPVLHREGLSLVSWTRRGFDTREHDPERVLARLTHKLAGGDILLLHDGHAMASWDSGRPIVLDVLSRLLAQCRDAGLRPVTLLQALPQRGSADGAGVARAAA